MKKYEVIYHKYKEDILNGFLKKGDRLLSIRQACDLFKVSQTTVEHAYDLLVMDGYIRPVFKAGYVVCLSNDQVMMHKKMEACTMEQVLQKYRYDFRSKSVSYDSFEIFLWKRYLKQIVSDAQIMASYGDSQGEFALRQALSQYVYRNRGILCDARQVWIGSNFQSLLFAFCGMLDGRSRIGMEFENNAQALRVFRSYGFEVQNVNFDDLSNVDVLYVNTACIGESKCPITKELQTKILEQASKYNILIIEDDYNGELTYRSKSRHSLFSADVEGRIIYCGAFSRLLLPSVRISYLILNGSYCEFYERHRLEYGPMASKLEQLAMARYIVDGGLEKHLRKLRREYRKKSLRMEACLKQWDVDYRLKEAYMCYEVFVSVPTDFESLCAKNQIGVSVRSDHVVELSFASIGLDSIEDAMDVLKNILF